MGTLVRLQSYGGHSRQAKKPYAFGPPLPTTKKTRRPRLRYVSTLLAEAEEIHIQIPEVALIERLQAQAAEWDAEAGRVHESEAKYQMRELIL